MKILYLMERMFPYGGQQSTFRLVREISKSKEFDVRIFGIPTDKTPKDLPIIECKRKRSLSLGYVLDLKKAISLFEPDLIHAMGFYTGMSSLIVRGSARRPFKIIMTLRHSATTFRFNRLSRLILPTLNKVDAINYLTDYQRKLYQPYGLLNTNYRIIPNIYDFKSRDLERFESKRRELLADLKCDYLLIFVGRLDENKQVGMVLLTIKQLQKKGGKCGLLLVGTGKKKYTDQLKRMVHELDLKSVLFLGYQEKPEVLMAASDLMIFPTKTEGLPNVILEAYDLGLPVLTSNIPHLKPLVSDERAFIACENTPECYSNEVTRILNSKDLRSKITINANAYLLKNFDKNYILQRYKELYFDVLDNR